MASCPKKKATIVNYFGPSSSSVSTSSESEDGRVERSPRNQRKFLLRWKILYPWAELEEGEPGEVIYCRDWRSANLKNPFAVGKTRPMGEWKKEYLQRHASSNDHVTFASQSFRKSQTSLFDDDRVPVRIGASEKAMLGLIRNIHFLVKNSIPLVKASTLHSLIDEQVAFYFCTENEASIPSDDEMPEFRSPMSHSHRSGYSSWEFVHSLNAVVEQDDILSLRNVRIYSLLVDESNDISTVKNLLIYFQFVNTQKCTVEVKFMKALPLKECDATSIAKEILNYFNENELPIEKVILFTSDGAAIMLGVNNGVHIKLKEHCPHLNEFHCVAHREALAVGQAYQSVNFYVRIESILKSIFSHFSHSSVRMQHLKEVFEVVDKKFVRLRKIHDVRWLSRYEAVNAIVKAYHPLLIYLENLSQTDVTAEGLAKQMKSYQFYVTVHFLLDDLSVLTQLNKTFQISGYNPYSALKKVDETCKALTSRYSDPILWGSLLQNALKILMKELL
jgi:hypothetical protein